VRVQAFILASLLALSASAQLPRVQLPPVSLPAVPALPGAERAVAGSLGQLSGARALRAERLFSEHRAELDRDPSGDLVVRAEVVAIDITDEALARAVKNDFLVLRKREFTDLGIKVTLLQTPPGMSATRGLKRLRKLDPEGTYDFNHLYFDSGEDVAVARSTVENAAAVAESRNRAGLIDGGIDDTHEALTGVHVHRFGCSGSTIPSIHGTAVAALMVARHSIGELYAADVYCDEPTGGSMESLADAFSWMAKEHVAVINVSLVGPRNALLERVVKTLVERGYIIVAAVGNDGPAAPPLYPAAFDGVVGVTAVDAKHQVLIEACRGKHVDFAALGLSRSAAAGTGNGTNEVRGTSFAAPIVTALLSSLAAPDSLRRQQLLDDMAVRAHDLGKPGRDNIYGAGEVGDAEVAIK
jgi:hypothetical protein